MIRFWGSSRGSRGCQSSSSRCSSTGTWTASLSSSSASSSSPSWSSAAASSIYQAGGQPDQWHATPTIIIFIIKYIIKYIIIDIITITISPSEQEEDHKSNDQPSPPDRPALTIHAKTRTLNSIKIWSQAGVILISHAGILQNSVTSWYHKLVSLVIPGTRLWAV